jgi:hypothetical protein
MKTQTVNQDNLSNNGMSDGHFPPQENGHYTSPTVHQFQEALLVRIKNYGRVIKVQGEDETNRQEKKGIEGVWNAIAPNLKYKVAYPPGNASQAGVRLRLSKSTFRKQVSRLKDESPTNEKMRFGMRGNILLLLNILEILEVKSVSDLLTNAFQQPNLESLIIASNLNSEIIQKKIDSLENTITSSLKHKPRIQNLKICRDLELILLKMGYII